MKEVLGNVKEMVFASCAIIIIIIAIMVCGWTEQHYTKKGTVIEVNEDDIISVVDDNGFIWDFEGTGFEEGTKVLLIMNTNKTDNTFFDDRVDNVKIINSEN